MLYDLVPAREISGGAFHAGHELDVEFIAILSKAVIGYLMKHVCKH